MNETEWTECLYNVTGDGYDAKARRDSGNWFSCAVGSKLQKDLGLENINPANAAEKANIFLTQCLTKEAYWLGNQFYHTIMDNDYARADYYFKKIHEMDISGIVKAGSYGDVEEAFKHSTDEVRFEGRAH